MGGDLVAELAETAHPPTVYLDAERVSKRLPGNERAAVLATHLGLIDQTWLADLRGDALLLGCDRRGQDTDVPPNIVDAARHAALFPTS